MNPSTSSFNKFSFNKFSFKKFASKTAVYWLLALVLPIAGCGLLPKPAPAVDAFVPRVDLAKCCLGSTSSINKCCLGSTSSINNSTLVPRYARLTVIRPIAPVYLDTSEPQLIDEDGSWLRIPGFRFAATPAELLQNLLANGIEQSGVAGAVLTHQADDSPKIEIELRAFAVERSASGMQAHVAYSIRLNAKPPRATRIEVKVPVASLASSAVRAAWQAACEQALRQTLSWLQEAPQMQGTPVR